MAKHEFALMDHAPGQTERFDEYEPRRFRLIAVDDEYIEPLLPQFDQVDCYWHTLAVPGKGLAYYGITLIPPEACASFLAITAPYPALRELTALFCRAREEGKFIIHYGL